jgi:hypothetical protein
MLVRIQATDIQRISGGMQQVMVVISVDARVEPRSILTERAEDKVTMKLLDPVGPCRITSFNRMQRLPWNPVLSVYDGALQTLLQRRLSCHSRVTEVVIPRMTNNQQVLPDQFGLSETIDFQVTIVWKMPFRQNTTCSN